MLEIVMMSAVVLTLPGTSEDIAPYEILAPGTYHGDDVEIAINGEIWLGVFETTSGYELRPAVISVEEAPDPYLDRDGAQTARMIYAEGSTIDPDRDWDYQTDRWFMPEADRLMFLLRPVDSVFIEGDLAPVLTDSPDLPPDTTIVLGNSGQLLVTGEDGLFLVDGGTSQRLSDVYPESVGEFVSVVWAGDLDGDGRIDLLLDDQPHYAYRCYYRLFLSGEAEPGELFKEVAVFVATSC